ncbi:amidohydrolase [Herbaspirillum sp. LeCh32-8]|uniref:amidohydrolase n=1 Tax=Herbaspirillum sp. LeCh32-8 TaxID=2821356 RepID=UPI001AE37AA0|nr:amidohydrolase [Herbaspirillum sp. LeCh32-8]MBP0597709.1 amidohydrolase [Herbaspirillum sp. LeCh32-8]
MPAPILRMSACLGLLCLVATASAQPPSAGAPAVSPQITAMYPEVEALYRDLHQHPELGFEEWRTSEKLAHMMRKLGYEVTTGVGVTGLVALMKNGDGPTIMLRTDLDALPVLEKTGVSFASKVRTKNASGQEVPAMHACGHDFHMAAWYGTARLMAENRDKWRGTLMLVGQPAEELVGGANAMLKDGLFERFPKPDYALAMHDDSDLPAGQIGYRAGYFMAASDVVEISVYGRGGHGAMPQNTVDPIVLAARIVAGLQTIVSREIDPMDPTIVTIGSIHGGTRANIIPDEVKLQLSVRTFDPAVRKRVMAAIERQARGEAMAMNAPAMPKVEVQPGAISVYNDPALVTRVTDALRVTLGSQNVVEVRPKTPSEDFSQYYAQAGVPSAMLIVGAADPKALAVAKEKGEPLPGPHSPLFIPFYQTALQVAIAAESSMLTTLLKK